MIEKIKNSKKQIAFGIACVFIFIVFALYYGYFPEVTISGLGLNYCVMGNVSGGVLNDTQSFYPYGGRIFEGYGVYLLNYIFNIIINDASASSSLTYFTLFLISFVSFLYLGKKILKNEFIILGAAIVFYLTPYFTSGVPLIGPGAMLITFSLFLDYKVFLLGESNAPTKKDYIIGLVTQFLGRLLIVSISWYIAVITAVFSCLWMLIYYVLKGVQKKSVKEILKFGTVVVPWFLAMLLILIITPSSTSEFSSGLDFLNACSIPILSMFLPSDSLLISNVISTFDSMVPEGYMLAGDGTMWQNYMGYSLLISFGIGVFLKTDKKNIKVAIVLTTLVGLVLALGPGLKFIGLVPDNGAVANYHLDFSETYMFPWANLFNMFPLTIMRAVYRWFLIFRVGVLIVAFIVWAKLWENKKCRMLVILLMLLAIVEYYPNGGVATAVEDKIANMETVELFEEDVINPLNELLDEDELIAICSYGEDPNGYMIPYITELCDVRTYAGAGDKPKIIAEAYMPNSIKTLQNTGDAAQLAYYISQAFEECQCDAVLLPYFNVRWESYYWRPSDSTLNKYRQITVEIKDVLEERYDVYETEYFMLIKNNSEDRYELINDASYTQFMKSDSEAIYQKKHMEISENQSVQTNITFENDDMAYYALCYNGDIDENLYLNIKEFDSNGTCIKENSFEYAGTGQYAFCENTIVLQEQTTNLVAEVKSSNIVELKNFVVEGYNSDNLILSIEGNKTSNYLIKEESELVHDGLLFEDNTKPYISEMTMEFEFYCESTETDLDIISKYLGWNNEMSYAVLLKGDYLTVALSNTGSASENFYIDKNVIVEGQWNTFKVKFDEGNLHIWINDTYFHKTYSFDSIYGSLHPIALSAGDYQIRNLSLEYK